MIDEPGLSPTHAHREAAALLESALCPGSVLLALTHYGADDRHVIRADVYVFVVSLEIVTYGDGEPYACVTAIDCSCGVLFTDMYLPVHLDSRHGFLLRVT